jgi:hypothetical protein
MAFCLQQAFMFAQSFCLQTVFLFSEGFLFSGGLHQQFVG